MKISEVLSNKIYNCILSECEQFLTESRGRPLYNCVSVGADELRKIKVRKRKGGEFDEQFNEAFRNHPDLRQRAIFASGTKPVCEPLREIVYVFPIDGYKFIYSRAVAKSSETYPQLFDSISGEFGSESSNVIVDMLSISYKANNLAEGISSGGEIIVYNLPYYYALPVNMDYAELTKILKS